MRALGAELGDDEPRLDRLAEPDLVGENAAAIAQATQGKDDGINLMRVRINPGMALRRRVPFAIVRAANQRELLRQ